MFCGFIVRFRVSKKRGMRRLGVFDKTTMGKATVSTTDCIKSRAGVSLYDGVRAAGNSTRAPSHPPLWHESRWGDVVVWPLNRSPAWHLEEPNTSFRGHHLGDLGDDIGDDHATLISPLETNQRMPVQPVTPSYLILTRTSLAAHSKSNM